MPGGELAAAGFCAMHTMQGCLGSWREDTLHMHMALQRKGTPVPQEAGGRGALHCDCLK